MHSMQIFPAARRCAPLGLAGLLAAASLPAHALPSFARQTGEECAACHVGAFGPQLNAHGIKFKLGGYTDSDGKAGHMPLSGMLLANWTHTSTDNPTPPQHFNANNNLALQEASLFLGGKLTDHLGSFVQTTYNGIERRFALDQMDLRYARTFENGGKDLLVGATLNNNPTVQDPFNTTATWRFPFTSSDLVIATPAVAPLIDGGLAQGVVGATAYALWDGSFYGELGGYRSMSASTLNKLGNDDLGKLKGTAPYWRLGYMKDMRKEMFAVGVFGLSADLDPNRTSGAYDKHRDIGIDATWQYLGDRKNIYTLHGSFTREDNTLNASAAGAGKGRLNSANLNASYFYDQTYGVTLGVFDTRGNSNLALWGPITGGNDKPDSRGYIAQLDWTPWGKESSWNAPWANLRLGLQYTGYSKFDGASAGAHDKNSLSVFAWTSF